VIMCVCVFVREVPFFSYFEVVLLFLGGGGYFDHNTMHFRVSLPSQTLVPR